MNYELTIGGIPLKFPDYESAVSMWRTFNRLAKLPPASEAIRPIGALDKPVRLATIYVQVT